ncbi:MAG: MFS transporter [Theionarchaea archaeon]|nr:MFS transporter [Theionarchaea archaeon]MBU6999820.1 MFS transporter [Theionarchaea archaeon]MBU7020240.1 MFS transporter [Theionarchaea archaeon]MBU7033641.1 MFS transporter [Theionarchaea archaeon]MBU7040080.1 MFS transporter [Theionarchaea archaeon]
MARELSSNTTRILYGGIIALGLAHFLTHFLEFALPAVYPLIREEFSLTYSDVGVISSSVVITLFIFQTPIGHVSDRKGRKYILIAFLSLLICSTFLTALSHSYMYLLLFQVLVGVGASAFHSAGMAMASDIAPHRKMGRYMAVQGFGGTFGVALVPLIVSLLGSILGWRYAIQGVALLGVPVLLCIFKLLQDTGRAVDSEEKDRVILSKKVIVLVLLGFVLQGFVFRGIVSFFPTYLVDVYGSSLKLAGSLTFLLFLGGAFAELVGGELSDRTEKLNVVIFSYGVRCALLYLINTLGNPHLLVILVIGFGFFQGMSTPAVASLIRDMSPSGSAGKSYGAVFSIATLTGFFSPLIVGYVGDLYSLRVSFYILTLALLCAFTFVVIARYFRFKETHSA